MYKSVKNKYYWVTQKQCRKNNALWGNKWHFRPIGTPHAKGRHARSSDFQKLKKIRRNTDDQEISHRYLFLISNISRI